MIHEIDGLMERACFTVVNRTSLPVNANVLGGRFVMEIKNAGSSEKKVKATYVV